jgi:hypothetical protein
MLDNIKFLAWQDYAGLNLNQKVKPKRSKSKMKRQILFRGWSELHNKWVEGNYVVDAIGGSRIVKPDSSGQGLTFIPVHPDSVGQFTGCLDCHRVKVFEGDINQDGRVVEFSYRSFIFTNKKTGDYALLGDCPFVHIKGNTFNPDKA